MSGDAWPRKSCIKALQQVADELGMSPTYNQYNKHRQEWMPSAQAVKRQFGTWNAAKEAANLTTYEMIGRNNA